MLPQIGSFTVRKLTITLTVSRNRAGACHCCSIAVTGICFFVRWSRAVCTGNDGYLLGIALPVCLDLDIYISLTRRNVRCYAIAWPIPMSLLLNSVFRGNFVDSVLFLRSNRVRIGKSVNLVWNSQNLLLYYHIYVPVDMSPVCVSCRLIRC